MPNTPFRFADDAALDEVPFLPCQHSPDLFFAESPEVLEHAKGLCGDCPIRSSCLREAIARDEPWGVWGGEILTAGRVVATKRGRGRPRKAAAA